MREKLPPRRMAVTEHLTYLAGQPGEVRFDVTYGYELDGPVKEVFCLAFKTGADRQQELHQACIAISVALQSGQSMADLARVMGEDDPDHPPHSIVGLIVRTGVMVDARRAGEIGMLRAAKANAAVSWIEQVQRFNAEDDARATELTEGISAEDPEDGGVLAAMDEAQQATEEIRSNVIDVPAVVDELAAEFRARLIDPEKKKSAAHDDREAGYISAEDEAAIVLQSATSNVMQIPEFLRRKRVTLTGVDAP